ncbi:MAG TPA: universal stress protein [Psychromonas sp.]
MSYKHVLVAIDLNEGSDIVISKAVSLAKNLDAKLSFISVDISHPDKGRKYDGVEVKLMEEKHAELVAQLQELAEITDYPIKNTIVLAGDVEETLMETISKMDVDLLVCGHHHGFWSRWWSTARKLVNISVVDLLFVHL